MRQHATMTRNGLTLKIIERLPCGLFLAECNGGILRLHTGAKNSGFRAYADTWRTQKRGKCYRVEIWDGAGRRVSRLAKTRAGAIRSLKYHAAELFQQRTS